MSNMSYYRHENTASDLADVVENWIMPTEHDGETKLDQLDSYEKAGRERIIDLAREIVQMADDAGE